MRRTLALAVLTTAALTVGTGSAAADYPSTGSFAIDEVNNGSSTLQQFPILSGSGKLVTGSALAVLTPIVLIMCEIQKLADPNACRLSIPENNG